MIAMAKSAFVKKRSLLSSDMKVTLRKKLIKSYVWTVVLYGPETWTLKKIEIETFEMWYC